jgi:5-methylcytosine-specific restriction endonuclease McrA
MPPVSPEAKARAAAKARERYYANREDRIAQIKAWKQANAERVRETERIRRSANLDKVTTYQKQYRQKNKSKVAAWEKKYKQSHPHVAATVRQRRRARVQNAPGEISSAHWKAIVAEFGDRCAYCNSGGPLEMEHMTPLSRSGSHSASNVVPACVSCNRRKGTQTLFEFLATPPPLLLEGSAL